MLSTGTLNFDPVPNHSSQYLCSWFRLLCRAAVYLFFTGVAAGGVALACDHPARDAAVGDSRVLGQGTAGIVVLVALHGDEGAGGRRGRHAATRRQTIGK